ncbi:MAG TPA: hypothetical protein VKZ63_12200 [Kofleriaceae bacterium]|nr:hypothetical protein [Kofleriaceae bacterium]
MGRPAAFSAAAEASADRAAAERTRANKEAAISFAVYRALVDLFPHDRDWLAAHMRRMGHDPDDTSSDPSTPAGVGNAAAAVLAYRRRDGSNQRGGEGGARRQPGWRQQQPDCRPGAPQRLQARAIVARRPGLWLASSKG